MVGREESGEKSYEKRRREIKENKEEEKVSGNSVGKEEEGKRRTYEERRGWREEL